MHFKDELLKNYNSHYMINRINQVQRMCYVVVDYTKFNVRLLAQLSESFSDDARFFVRLFFR